jgi:hypothetical protein
MMRNIWSGNLGNLDRIGILFDSHEEPFPEESNAMRSEHENECAQANGYVWIVVERGGAGNGAGSARPGTFKTRDYR